MQPLGDAALRDAALGRQFYPAEVNFLSSVIFHRPLQTAHRSPGVNRPWDKSHGSKRKTTAHRLLRPLSGPKHFISLARPVSSSHSVQSGLCTAQC